MTSGQTHVDEPGFAEALSSIEDILADMRNGRMVVLVDAEDRENEGDLVAPAQMATPDVVNFMAKHGRGLICLTLTKERSEHLGLEQMVRANASRNRTAFTQSIEAKDGITTGISAHDRAHTIATAIGTTKSADDIVSPGHVFPLVARDGGVLVRAGHTEASVDLARLAGLLPAAVICEIMNDDGTMARMPDLVSFAKEHGLKIGTIEDLIAYRLKNEEIVRRVKQMPIESAFGGALDMHVYETTVEPGEHLALVKGNISGPEPVLVRVHAMSPFKDLLGIDVPVDATASSVVEASLKAIDEEGRGVLILVQDLSPQNLSRWIGERHNKQTEVDDSANRRQVEIGVGSQILRDLGVNNMILLTNSPAHVYVGLDGFGLQVSGTRSIG
ncbi:MAG: 3,4-dihydroxy-2-butanone-4-phosphate synthase [Hyphomicrobiaceae bacterium]